MDDLTALRYLRRVGFFLLLGPTLLALYIETQPINFSDRAYPLWAHQLDFARSSGDGNTGSPAAERARVLILGDSRVQAALIPDQIGPRAQSLALMSSTPIDSYFLLRDYLVHHETPDWIVFSFAPYHLQRDNESFFWNHSVKFGAHGFGDFLELLERSHELREPLIPGAGRLRVAAQWLLYRIKFPPYYMAELKSAILVARRKENLAVATEIKERRGHYFYGLAEGSSAISKEAQLESFGASPLLDVYLRRGIELAQNAGSEVLLRAMPMNESSHRALSPRFAAEYRSYLEQLGRAYPQIVADPELSFLPDLYFGDGSHVNRRGAMRLSGEFVAFLDSRSSLLAGVGAQR